MSKANTELFEMLKSDAFQAYFCKTVKKLMHFFHISVFGVCHENQLNNIKTVQRSHLSTTQWVGQGNEIDQKKSSKNVLRPNNTKRRTKWEISPPPLIIRGIRRKSWPCTRGLWRTLVTRGRGCQPFSSSIVSARIAMQVHCNTLLRPSMKAPCNTLVGAVLASSTAIWNRGLGT